MSMAEARNDYDVLGAFPGASPAPIKQAYRRAATRWHPDKVDPADKALAERRFKEVAEAYGVVCDLQERRAFDMPGGIVHVPFSGWEEFRRIFGEHLLDFSPGTLDFLCEVLKPLWKQFHAIGRGNLAAFGSLGGIIQLYAHQFPKLSIASRRKVCFSQTRRKSSWLWISAGGSVGSLFAEPADIIKFRMLWAWR